MDKGLNKHDFALRIDEGGIAFGMMTNYINFVIYLLKTYKPKVRERQRLPLLNLKFITTVVNWGFANSNWGTYMFEG